MSDFLNMLRGRGLLADIDVAFARFIGRNANGEAALTLLAAIISNAASAHREIALPASRIGTRESLRKFPNPCIQTNKSHPRYIFPNPHGRYAAYNTYLRFRHCS